MVDERLALAGLRLAAVLKWHISQLTWAGELLGRVSSYKYDSELLYLETIMPDLGLTETFAGQERLKRMERVSAASSFQKTGKPQVMGQPECRRRRQEVGFGDSKPVSA